jgi:hypothetical protein
MDKIWRVNNTKIIIEDEDLIFVPQTNINVYFHKYKGQAIEGERLYGRVIVGHRNTSDKNIRVGYLRDLTPMICKYTDLTLSTFPFSNTIP